MSDGFDANPVPSRRDIWRKGATDERGSVCTAHRLVVLQHVAVRRYQLALGYGCGNRPLILIRDSHLPVDPDATLEGSVWGPEIRARREDAVQMHDWGEVLRVYETDRGMKYTAFPLTPALGERERQSPGCNIVGRLARAERGHGRSLSLRERVPLRCASIGPERFSYSRGGMRLSLSLRERVGVR